jgi:radical SAM superfamily enzyme YgiQ (UPF0313 family)
LAEIDWAAAHLGRTRRVFLGDGDAISLSTDRLLRLLEALYDRLPGLRRVSAYAAPQSFRRKPVGDLERLRDAGLTQVYVGFESGDDEVLARVNKGVGHDEMVELCLRPQRAGLKLSAMIVLGLGGPRLSRRHAEESGRLIDEIRPRFASALTLMLEPGSDRYAREFGDPGWRLLDPLEMIAELRHLVAAVTADGIIFRSNHASNYLALAGVFQKSKQRMLDEIDAVLGDPELNRVRPECTRGL